MASSSANSWIPHGRHEVQIGPSLNRALKARKGAPPPPAKRTGPPEKDFYSFRYNFKPPSVDNTKPGSIELTRSKDATTVAVEHASSQPGESYIYHGNETSAKEFDCVLIYDEETGSYKLEKLESYIVLTYDHKNTVSIPPPTPPTKVEDDTVYSMEDADGEPDDGEMPTQFIPAPQEEEEEEEGEFEELLPPPPPPPVKPPAKAPPPFKQRPEPAVAPRPTKPVPQRKNTKKAAPPPVQHDANVEEFTDIARPSAKRAKRASSPVSFALPGMSMSNWVPPPAPAPLPTQNHRAPPIPIPPPASPPAPAPASDSEEDDWDEVPPEPLVISAPAEEEAPQEIDLQDFEQTLEAAMEAEMGMDEDEEEEGSEPEDFLAEAMPQAPADDAPARPLSMSQLGGFSEDEYSSSEDSDDD